MLFYIKKYFFAIYPICIQIFPFAPSVFFFQLVYSNQYTYKAYTIHFVIKTYVFISSRMVYVCMLVWEGFIV